MQASKSRLSTSFSSILINSFLVEVRNEVADILG